MDAEKETQMVDTMLQQMDLLTEMSEVKEEPEKNNLQSIKEQKMND